MTWQKTKTKTPRNTQDPPETRKTPRNTHDPGIEQETVSHCLQLWKVPTAEPYFCSLRKLKKVWQPQTSALFVAVFES